MEQLKPMVGVGNAKIHSLGNSKFPVRSHQFFPPPRPAPILGFYCIRASVRALKYRYRPAGGAADLGLWCRLVVSRCVCQPLPRCQCSACGDEPTHGHCLRPLGASLPASGRWCSPKPFVELGLPRGWLTGASPALSCSLPRWRSWVGRPGVQFFYRTVRSKRAPDAESPDTRHSRASATRGWD